MFKKFIERRNKLIYFNSFKIVNWLIFFNNNEDSFVKISIDYML